MCALFATINCNNHFHTTVITSSSVYPSAFLDPERRKLIFSALFFPNKSIVDFKRKMASAHCGSLTAGNNVLSTALGHFLNPSGNFPGLARAQEYASVSSASSSFRLYETDLLSFPQKREEEKGERKEGRNSSPEQTSPTPEVYSYERHGHWNLLPLRSEVTPAQIISELQAVLKTQPDFECILPISWGRKEGEMRHNVPCSYQIIFRREWRVHFCEIALFRTQDQGPKGKTNLYLGTQAGYFDNPRDFLQGNFQHLLSNPLPKKPVPPKFQEIISRPRDRSDWFLADDEGATDPVKLTFRNIQEFLWNDPDGCDAADLAQLLFLATAKESFFPQFTTLLMRDREGVLHKLCASPQESWLWTDETLQLSTDLGILECLGQLLRFPRFRESAALHPDLMGNLQRMAVNPPLKSRFLSVNAAQVLHFLQQTQTRLLQKNVLSAKL